MKPEGRKTLVVVWMLLIATLASYAQAGDDAWKNLVEKETEYYKFSVPASWRQIEMSAGMNPEQYFEASGKLLPATYNQAPVIVTIFLVKLEANNLAEAKEMTVKDYKKSSDRVFAKGFSHEEKSVTLKSGEKAYLLNTRFYHTEKGLNQSRYDLVVYSPRAKSAYLYTLSVQYKDAEYGFETRYALKEIAKKLYASFQLKRK